MFCPRLFIILLDECYTHVWYIRTLPGYWIQIWNKRKNNKFHTVEIFPKSNRKIVERSKIDTLGYKYMTTHLPVFLWALHYKKCVWGRGEGREIRCTDPNLTSPS